MDHRPHITEPARNRNVSSRSSCALGSDGAGDKLEMLRETLHCLFLEWLIGEVWWRRQKEVKQRGRAGSERSRPAYVSRLADRPLAE